MVLFPNCKINLGLNIIRKRTDGYHDLETVFYPIAIRDALEAIRGNTEGIQFTSSGLTVNGSPDDNLCVKAYHLLQKDYPGIPPLQMHLHKTIPMGAGLGGGSADGAFALLLINDVCNLGLTAEQLIPYALALGSDCPFFLYNKPCFATGRGEAMQPAEVNLSGYYFILVNPGIHISTKEAFAHVQPGIPGKPISEIIQQPIHTWKQELVNDFEASVFQQHPAIRNIRETLYAQGAVYASMTGTGSTVYGIFEKGSTPVLPFPPDWVFYEND